MNPYKFRCFLFLSIFLITISAYPLHAKDSGTFTGTVRDSVSGEPLAYALVMIPGTGYYAKADRQGGFSITGIPEGNYFAQCVYPGYQNFQSDNLTIQSGQQTRMPIYLTEISDDFDDATLDEDRPLDQTGDEKGIIVFKSADFRNWPFHDYQSIVNIRAGYTLYTPSRNLTQQKDNMHIRGGQPFHSAVFIDETADRNAFTGNAEIGINKNAIEEIITMTGNGNAEYGAYQSGVIQVRTKNPADRYSGHVEYITDFAAPAFFSYSYGYQNGSFGFGGPLIPGYNKIKFYVSGEGQIFDDAEPSVFGFPKYVADSTGRSGNPFYSYLNYSNIKDWSRDTVKISGWDPANGIYNTQYKKGARPKTLNGDGCNSLKFGNFYGKLIYDVNEKMKVTFHSAYGQTTRRIFTPEKTFNIDHVTRLEKKYHQWGGNVSYQISDHSMFEFGGHLYSSRTREMDDRFGWNINWYSENIGRTYPYSIRNYGIFESPGRGNKTFRQDEIQTVTLKSSYTSQIFDNHQIKAGVDYTFHTIGMIDVMDLTADPVFGMNNNMGYSIFADSTGRLFIKKNRKDNYDNRSVYGNRHPLDGFKHPFSAGIYVQDRISYDAYSIWAGLGVYLFNSGTKRIKDLYNPLGKPGVDPVLEIGPEDFKNPKTFRRLSPRAGINIRISDEITLYSSAGKFVQQPSFQNMYVSAKTFEQMVTAPPVTMVIGNPNIKPEKSFHGELGGKVHIPDYLSLNMVLYHKHIYNPIGVSNIMANPAGGYYSFLAISNGGSANIYGLSLEALTKRSNKFQGYFSLNYQEAEDHGNISASGFRSAWLGYTAHSFTAYSYYDQRFKGSLIVDIRNDQEEGFAIGNYYPLENAGIIIYETFALGFPYTPTDPVAINGDNIVGRVNGRHNSKRIPKFHRFDLKADKTFALSNSVSMQVYILVLNVLNRKNPIDVYTSSGKANDDGFRSTVVGQAVVAGNGPEYNEQYNIRMKNGLFYDTPRQVRLGFLMNF